jgi:hypothetical protein
MTFEEILQDKRIKKLLVLGVLKVYNGTTLMHSRNRILVVVWTYGPSGPKTLWLYNKSTWQDPVFTMEDVMDSISTLNRS